jgi:hypothetical protein
MMLDESILEYVQQVSDRDTDVYCKLVYTLLDSAPNNQSIFRSAESISSRRSLQRPSEFYANVPECM